jgi:hypothetical protein
MLSTSRFGGFGIRQPVLSRNSHVTPFFYNRYLYHLNRCIEYLIGVHRTGVPEIGSYVPVLKPTQQCSCRPINHFLSIAYFLLRLPTIGSTYERTESFPFVRDREI